MTHKCFEDYARIKYEQSRLKKEEKELKELCLKHLEESGDVELSTDEAKFTLGESRTWEYPAEINQLKESLDEAIEFAQAKGYATYISKPKLTCTLKKK